MFAKKTLLIGTTLLALGGAPVVAQESGQVPAPQSAADVPKPLAPEYAAAIGRWPISGVGRW